MRNLKLWVVALIVWLIFIFNIERINSPINVRSYTYIFVAIAALIALALPRTRRLSYIALLFIPVPSFLLFKAIWRGDTVFGEALPLTITQVCAIILTGFITRQISYGLRDIEQLVNTITSGYIGKLPKTFAEAEGLIYKELRRARRHQRPLSVVTLKLDPQSVQIALPRITKTVQQAMMNEYVLASITRILDENVTDFGTIALRDNHFIVVLPETPGNEAPVVAKNLQQAIQKEMNIQLFTGTASFPSDAVTFEALVELAITNTDGQPEPGQAASAHPASEQHEPEVISESVNGSGRSFYSQREQSADTSLD
jgi:hypothetical protein